MQLAGRQLVGVYLTIWVRRRLLRHVRGVQTTTVATGFGGYLGNKGAAAVRMRVFDTSLSFICSHLAAGGLALRGSLRPLLRRRAPAFQRPSAGGRRFTTARRLALPSDPPPPGPRLPSAPSALNPGP